MSYIFLENRGTEAKNKRNSNKNGKLRVPQAGWDTRGTKNVGTLGTEGHVGQLGHRFKSSANEPCNQIDLAVTIDSRF
jgi:hypothetical protein